MTMSFIFEQIRTGGDRNLGYLLGDRKAKVAMLIDPSYNFSTLLERAHDQNLSVKYICNTHGHHDHVNGNEKVKAITHAKIATYHTSSVPHDFDILDHSSLLLGNISLQFFHVPGHTEDHIIIFIPDYKIAITGDHLFVGKIGGTETDEQARQQYESFQRMFIELPEDTTIWPGHDVGCRPSSLWLWEKKTNPFLLTKNLEEFIHLKHHWPDFKTLNGLK